MAGKKSVASTKRPTLGDVLLTNKDIPGLDKPPVDLNAPRNLFVIDRLLNVGSPKGGAQISLSSLPGHSSALISDQPGTIFGHAGMSLEFIDVPKASSETPKDSEPFGPEWKWRVVCSARNHSAI
jgi:hypothetical protein